MELRYYQKAAIDSTLDYFRQGNTGNPLVVIPTGGGKSLTIAAFVRQVQTRWPDQRVCILAHRKELLEQNAAALVRHFPEVSLGIYSAGLKKRQLGRKVTVAGIQSVFRKATDVGWQALVLVDEAHLVPHEDEGMYRTFFDGLRTFNRKLKIIGYTATPFRMTSGLLTDGDGLFTDIAYEVGVKELVQAGFLSRLVSKRSLTQADLSAVHVRGGEYVAGEMEAAMDKDPLTDAAIDEMVRYGANRKSCLVFCSGVDHAEHFTAAIRKRGMDAECIVGKTEALFREQHIRRFREGRLRFLVNCEVLTTGFDAPNVDMIALLRPTLSVGLYSQMLGRGFRLAPGKENCLVLDFAGNVERHGPVDEITISRRRNPLTGESEGEVSTAPVKTCTTCQTVLVVGARECSECGYVFPEPELKHDKNATSAAVMSDETVPERYEVQSVDYRRHTKDGSPDMMRVVYSLGNLSNVSEYVCFEHQGYARHMAARWWAAHAKDWGGVEETPQTVAEALGRLRELKKIGWIETRKEKKFERVVAFGADEVAEREEAEAQEWLEERGINL